MPLDFTKLKHIINGGNSCYLDSFLIFMVIYRNTEFFGQFYEIPNNSDIFTGRYADYASILNKAIIGLYTELLNSNPDKTVCGHNRNGIRSTIGLIVNKLNITHKPKYPVDWISGQQDPVDFLSILTTIFRVNTNNLNIIHDYGFKYKAGKIVRIYNIEQELKELKELQPELYNSYVSTAESYMYTFTFNNHNKQPDSVIFAESGQKPPEELPLDDLKTMLVSGIGLPGNNSLIKFSGCDIINKKYTPYLHTTESGERVIIDKLIQLNDKLFAYCHGNENISSVITFKEYQKLFPKLKLDTMKDVKNIYNILEGAKVCETGDGRYTMNIGRLQCTIALSTPVEFENMIFAEWCVIENAPIYIINVNRVVQTINNTVKEFINTEIDIPEILINKCMEPNVNYKFIGAIVHAGFKEGTETHGHYTAFILNPTNNQYYFYNDLGTDKLTEVGDFKMVLDYTPNDPMTANIRTNCTTLFYLPEEEIKQLANKETYTTNTKSQFTTQNNVTEEEDEFFANDRQYNEYNPDEALINFIEFK